MFSHITCVELILYGRALDNKNNSIDITYNNNGDNIYNNIMGNERIENGS